MVRQKVQYSITIISLLRLLIIFGLIFWTTEGRRLNGPELRGPIRNENVDGFLNGFSVGATKNNNGGGGGGERFKRSFQSTTLGSMKNSGPSPGEGHKHGTFINP